MTSPPATTGDTRQFDFARDTFAYRNELVWEYNYDSAGKWRAQKRQPKPSYTLHCFVVARSARQFFENARFAPEQPVASEAIYRRLIRQVVSINPRRRLKEGEQIVIPGYSDLRSFSRAHEALLKAECGGAWQSYVQRGNWRMIFPFSRHQQEHVAEKMLAHLTPEHPLLVHVVRFPQLSINHTLLVYAAQEQEREIQFLVYDPNQPEAPSTLTYQRSARAFFLPHNLYFPGGRVDVYEICHRWNY